MKEPLLRDRTFLEDIERARNESRFQIWWLGQSGFLCQWGDRRLILDPYLSDSLTRKYEGTDKPHVRITARVIDPGELSGIHAITSSHAHTDHLDSETLRPLLQKNPGAVLVVPKSIRALAEERAGDDGDHSWPIIGTDAGMSLKVAGFEFYAVPAAHETVEKDEKGQCKYLGYIVRFGGWTLYHSGDTMRFEGLEEWLEPWDIDVALLPINGRIPERRVAGNLSGREAAELAWRIGARMVIPCHYDMFEFNTVTPDEFEDACKSLGQPYRVLQNGERWESMELSG